MTNCKNRIKPKLLREVKTEALLVFIRTTLEDYFKRLEKQEIVLTIGDDKENLLVSNILRELLSCLQQNIVDSIYLQNIMENYTKNLMVRKLAKQEEPLMVYYDSLVKGLEKNFNNGQFWMPELMVICLLSEWIIEEEKSTHLFPFLNKIDYLHILNIYEKEKMKVDNERKDIIMNMYKVSSYLISNLKNCKYKMNTQRKSKKRK
jgi:hypothetical protein